MGQFCSSVFVSIGCECCRTKAQKREEEDGMTAGKVNEVTTSGKIGTEKSAIKTELCEKYNIDGSRVAMWLDDRCTTSLVSEFVQSGGDGSGKALIMKENEVDMIILRCRNIDNGYENDAEQIDNDSYGNDDAYLTRLGWEMLCGLIEANANTLKVIYMEGIFITRMRMEILCEKLSKCNALIEIDLMDCSINFDKDRHVEKVFDESDSQGRSVEKRVYDGALLLLQATKEIESLADVNLDGKETVSPELEKQIDELVDELKDKKKRFSYIY